MHSIHAIWQDLRTSSEVHCIRVTVKEENMVRVHLSNCFLNPSVEGNEVGMIWVCRLIEWVVAGNL